MVASPPNRGHVTHTIIPKHPQLVSSIFAKDGLLWCPSRETTFAFRLGWVGVGCKHRWFYQFLKSVLLAGGLSGWLFIRWLVCLLVCLLVSLVCTTNNGHLQHQDLEMTCSGAHRPRSSSLVILVTSAVPKRWMWQVVLAPLADQVLGVSRCVSWWRRSPLPGGPTQLGCRWQKLQLTENYGIRWNPESSRANMKGWKGLQRL